MGLSERAIRNKRRWSQRARAMLEAIRAATKRDEQFRVVGYFVHTGLVAPQETEIYRAFVENAFVQRPAGYKGGAVHCYEITMEGRIALDNPAKWRKT